MMATRSEKLKAIAQKAKQAQQPKEVKLDASDVAKVLDKQISDFKALFDSGVELKAAELIEELGKIKAFVPVIERFTAALSEIKVPDTIDVNIPESIELEGLHELKDVISTQSTILKSLSIPESIELQGVNDLKTVFEQQSKLLASVTIPSTVELDGLPQLVKLINKYVNQISKLEVALGKEKTVHVDFINDSGVKVITDALGELSKAVGSNTTIANQAPSEAIPVRRVRKIGERLIFDDDVWTGSNAGGASVQDSLIENGRVKVDIGENIQVSVGPSVEISNDVGNPVPVSGTVSVTEPVTVDATNLDIRDLSSATDSVTTVPSGTQTVSGTVEVTNDVGNPIPVSGTVSVTEPVTVDATDLDIRDLAFATDKVDASGTVLGAGANAIGKLAANSGVDIGDVDVTSVIPGTGATNLGKAIDSAVGATDTGIAMLGKVTENAETSATHEGDYDTPSLTNQRELRTRDQRTVDLANCNDSTAFTTLGNDTLNLANSTAHVFGTGAVTFDKVNGAANTIYAGIQDTITTIDIQEAFESGGFVGLSVYLPSLSNVSKVFLRIGTDSSNYNAWVWDVTTLTAATWLNLRNPTSSPDKARSIGNGWNTNAISYVSFGVEFTSETATLAGIIFDHVHMVGGRVTSTDISAAVTSSVNTPNINVHRMGGTPTDTSSGNLSAGTQRVVIATDDPNLSAVKTAVEIIDNTVYTEGDTDASITGVPILWEDTSNTLRAVSAAKPLPITGSLSLAAANYATRIDEASATVTYIGSADPGSATSGALWQVKKIDSNNPTSITFADGNALFDNIWDDRASLTYS